MLAKLMKYDLKYIYKYWWIGAVTSLLLSIFGGVCIKILIENGSEAEPTLPIIMAMLGIMATFLGIYAFSILTSVLIYVRFYKNFFSDEGYLTFTLPVKTRSLLNSKLLSAFIVNFSYSVVIGLGATIAVAIAIIGYYNDFWTLLRLFVTEGVPELFDYFGAYTVIYPLEIILMSIIMPMASTLFTFCCISFASVITKKARVITAIGIYYLASTITSSVLQLLYQFGFISFFQWVAKVSANEAMAATALMMLAVILFAALICGVLYVLQFWMIDRKLNMA